MEISRKKRKIGGKFGAFLDKKWVWGVGCTIEKYGSWWKNAMQVVALFTTIHTAL